MAPSSNVRWIARRIIAALLLAIGVGGTLPSSASANWLNLLSKGRHITPNDKTPDSPSSTIDALPDKIVDLARHLPERHVILRFDADSVTIRVHSGQSEYQTFVTQDRHVLVELWRDASVGEMLIPESDLAHVSAWLPDDGTVRRFRVAGESDSVTDGWASSNRGRARVAVRLSEHIEYDVTAGGKIEGARKLMEVPFTRGNLRVVSLFDDRDVDILRALDDAAGDTHRIVPDVSTDALANIAEEAKRGVVAIVGHVEDGAFVVRAPDGSIRSKVALADVENVLEAHEATGIFLGCATAAAGVTGLPHCVNALDVARGLNGTRSARTYGDVLDRIAESSGGLVMESKFVDGALHGFDARRRRDLIDARLDRGWFAVRVTTSALSDVQFAATGTINARSLLAVVWRMPALFVLWAIGMFVSVFVIRGEWRYFRDNFPVQASELSGSVRRAVVKAGRFLSFVVFTPMATGLELVLLLFAAFFLLGLALEGWTNAMWLALAGAVAQLVSAKQDKGWFRTAWSEWRSEVMIGGLGLFIGAVLFDRPILGGPDGGPATRPSGWIEEAGILLASGLVMAGFIEVQRRWRVGVSLLPTYAVIRGVYSSARWLDRQSQREWGRTV